MTGMFSPAVVNAHLENAPFKFIIAVVKRSSAANAGMLRRQRPLAKPQDHAVPKENASNFTQNPALLVPYLPLYQV